MSLALFAQQATTHKLKSFANRDVIPAPPPPYFKFDNLFLEICRSVFLFPLLLKKEKKTTHINDRVNVMNVGMNELNDE